MTTPTTSMDDVHSIAPLSTSPDDHTIVETTPMPTASPSDDSHTTMTTTTVSFTPSVTSTLIITLASQNTVASSAPVPYYAVGILAVLVLLVGTLAVLMLIFYVRKHRKEKKQRNCDGEAILVSNSIDKRGLICNGGPEITLNTLRLLRL